MCKYILLEDVQKILRGTHPTIFIEIGKINSLPTYHIESQWIKYSDRTPNMYDTCIIYFHNGENYTAIYLGAGIFENQQGDRYDIPDFWQPLPLLPK